MKCLGLLVFVLFIQLFSANPVDINYQIESDHAFGERGKSGVSIDVQIHHGNEKYAGIANGLTGLTGPLTSIASSLVKSASTLHSVLYGLHDSKSTVLFSVSKDLLVVIDILSDLTGNASDIFRCLTTNTQETFSSIERIVSGSNNQQVAEVVNIAISKVSTSLREVIKLVGNGANVGSADRENLDHATSSVATSLKFLMKTISLITETTTRYVGSVAVEKQEVVTSLLLILDTVLIITEITITPIACLLTTSSSTLSTVLLTLDETIQGISSIIILIKESLNTNLAAFLSTMNGNLLTLTNALNTSWQVSEGVSINGRKPVSDIGPLNWSLKWIQSNCGLTTTTFTRSLPSVVSKISQSLTLLDQINDSVGAVRQPLSNDLDKYFSQISASCDDIREIDGVMGPVRNAIDSIQLVLQRLLKINESSNSGNALEEILNELSWRTRILVSTVSAIFDAVVIDASKLSANVLESLLSLPLLLPSVLIYVQGCLSNSLPVVDSIVNQNLQTIASTVSNALKQLTEILSFIGANESSNLGNTVVEVSKMLNEVNKLMRESFSTASRGTVDIVFSIEDLVTQSVTRTFSELSHPVGDIRNQDILNNLVEARNLFPDNVDDVKSELETLLNGITSSASTVLLPASHLFKSTHHTLSSDTPTETLVHILLQSISNHFDTILKSIRSLRGLGDDVGITFDNSVSTVELAFNNLATLLNGDNTSNSEMVATTVASIKTAAQSLTKATFTVTNAVVDAMYFVNDLLSQSFGSLQYVLAKGVVVVDEVISAVPELFSSIPETVVASIQKITSVLSNILEIISEVLTKIVQPKISLIEIAGNIPNSIQKLVTQVLASDAIDIEDISNVFMGVFRNILGSVRILLPGTENRQSFSLDSITLYPIAVVSTITDILRSVCKVLSSATRSGRTILFNLNESFSSIFNAIIETSGRLKGVLGSEVDSIITNAIGDVEFALTKLGSVLTNSEAFSTGLEATITGISKTLQHLNSGGSGTAVAKAEAVQSLQERLSTAIGVVGDVLTTTTAFSTSQPPTVLTCTQPIENLLSQILNSFSEMSANISEFLVDENIVHSIISALSSYIQKITPLISRSNDGVDVVSQVEAVEPLDTINHLSRSTKTVSSHQFGILSTVTDKLNSVYDVLASVETTQPVLNNLIQSTPSIFDTIIESTGGLRSVLGVDVVAIIANTISDVDDCLLNLGSDTTNTSGEAFSTFLKTATEDTARALQLIISTIFSVTEAFAKDAKIDLPNDESKCVLSLQYVLSTIVGVADRVLIAVSEFERSLSPNKASVAGRLRDVVSHILNNISEIPIHIAGFLPEGDVADVLTKITTFITTDGHSILSKLEAVSGVAFNEVLPIQSVLESRPPKKTGKANVSPVAVPNVMEIKIGPVLDTEPAEGLVDQSIHLIKHSEYRMDRKWSPADWIATNFDHNTFSGSLSTVTPKISSIIQSIDQPYVSSDADLQRLHDGLDKYFSEILSSCNEIQGIDGVTSIVKDAVNNMQLSLRNLLTSTQSIDSAVTFETNFKDLSTKIQVLVSIITATFDAVVDVASKLNSKIVESVLSLSYVLSSALIYVQEAVSIALHKNVDKPQNCLLVESVLVDSVKHCNQIPRLMSSNVTNNLSNRLKDVAAVLREIKLNVANTLIPITGTKIKTVLSFDEVVTYSKSDKFIEESVTTSTASSSKHIVEESVTTSGSKINIEEPNYASLPEPEAQLVDHNTTSTDLLVDATPKHNITDVPVNISDPTPNVEPANFASISEQNVEDIEEGKISNPSPTSSIVVGDNSYLPDSEARIGTNSLVEETHNDEDVPVPDSSPTPDIVVSGFSTLFEPVVDETGKGNSKDVPLSISDTFVEEPVITSGVTIDVEEPTFASTSEQNVEDIEESKISIPSPTSSIVVGDNSYLPDTEARIGTNSLVEETHNDEDVPVPDSSPTPDVVISDFSTLSEPEVVSDNQNTSFYSVADETPKDNGTSGVKINIEEPNFASISELNVEEIKEGNISNPSPTSSIVVGDNSYLPDTEDQLGTNSFVEETHNDEDMPVSNSSPTPDDVISDFSTLSEPEVVSDNQNTSFYSVADETPKDNGTSGVKINIEEPNFASISELNVEEIEEGNISNPSPTSSIVVGDNFYLPDTEAQLGTNSFVEETHNDEDVQISTSSSSPDIVVSGFSTLSEPEVVSDNQNTFVEEFSKHHTEEPIITSGVTINVEEPNFASTFEQKFEDIVEGKISIPSPTTNIVVEDNSYLPDSEAQLGMNLFVEETHNDEDVPVSNSSPTQDIVISDLSTLSEPEVVSNNQNTSTDSVVDVTTKYHGKDVPLSISDTTLQPTQPETSTHHSATINVEEPNYSSISKPEIHLTEYKNTFNESGSPIYVYTKDAKDHTSFNSSDSRVNANFASADEPAEYPADKTSFTYEVPKNNPQERLVSASDATPNVKHANFASIAESDSEITFTGSYSDALPKYNGPSSNYVVGNLKPAEVFLTNYDTPQYKKSFTGSYVDNIPISISDTTSFSHPIPTNYQNVPSNPASISYQNVPSNPASLSYQNVPSNPVSISYQNVPSISDRKSNNVFVDGIGSQPADIAGIVSDNQNTSTDSVVDVTHKYNGKDVPLSMSDTTLQPTQSKTSTHHGATINVEEPNYSSISKPEIHLTEYKNTFNESGSPIYVYTKDAKDHTSFNSSDSRVNANFASADEPAEYPADKTSFTYEVPKNNPQERLVSASDATPNVKHANFASIAESDSEITFTGSYSDALPKYNGPSSNYVVGNLKPAEVFLTNYDTPQYKKSFTGSYVDNIPISISDTTSFSHPIPTNYQNVPSNPASISYQNVPSNPASISYQNVPSNPASISYQNVPSNPVSISYQNVPSNPASISYQNVPSNQASISYQNVPSNPASISYQNVPSNPATISYQNVPSNQASISYQNVPSNPVSISYQNVPSNPASISYQNVPSNQASISYQNVPSNPVSISYQNVPSNPASISYQNVPSISDRKSNNVFVDGIGSQPADIAGIVSDNQNTSTDSVVDVTHKYNGKDVPLSMSDTTLQPTQSKTSTHHGATINVEEPNYSAISKPEIHLTEYKKTFNESGSPIYVYTKDAKDHTSFNSSDSRVNAVHANFASADEPAEYPADKTSFTYEVPKNNPQERLVSASDATPNVKHANFASIAESDSEITFTGSYSDALPKYNGPSSNYVVGNLKPAEVFLTNYDTPQYKKSFTGSYVDNIPISISDTTSFSNPIPTNYQNFPSNPASISYQNVPSNPASLSYQNVPSNPASISYQKVPSNQASISYQNVPSNPASISYQNVPSNQASKSYQNVPSNPASISYQNVPSNQASISYQNVPSNTASISYQNVPSNQASISYQNVPSISDRKSNVIVDGIGSQPADIAGILETSIRDISKSLKVLSTCPSKTLSKVSVSLNNFVNQIAGVTGSPRQILSTLNQSLTGIFVTLRLTVSSLILQIGSISNSMGALFSGVETSLSKLFSCFNLNGNLKQIISNLDDAAKNVASSVNGLLSQFSALILSVSSAVNGTPDIVTESIAALQAILSVYVLIVESVLASVVSVVQIEAGSITPTIKQVTVSVLVALRELASITTNVSGATSGVSGSVYNSLRMIISKLPTTLKSVTTKLSDSLSTVTGVVQNALSSIKLVGSLGVPSTSVGAVTNSVWSTPLHEAVTESFKKITETLKRLSSVKGVFGNVDVIVNKIERILKTLISLVSKLNRATCNSESVLNGILDSTYSNIDQLRDSITSLVNSVGAITQGTLVIPNDSVAILEGVVEAVTALCGNVNTFVTGALESLSGVTIKTIGLIEPTISTSGKLLAKSVNDVTVSLTSGLELIIGKRGILSSLLRVVSSVLSKTLSSLGATLKVINSGKPLVLNNVNRLNVISSANNLSNSINTILKTLGNASGNFKFVVSNNGCRVCKTFN